MSVQILEIYIYLEMNDEKKIKKNSDLLQRYLQKK